MKTEKTKMNAITEFRGEHAFLSNFHPSPIALSGIEFPTVEHAFVAAKTFDPDVRKHISGIPEPKQAKRFGRVLELREDWEEVKDAYMLTLVQAKFQFHPDLGEKLLDTHPKILIEGNYWNDTYWGMVKESVRVRNGSGIVDLPRWRGQNKLGKILMQVRKELQNGS